jgi:hypothetical protein
LTSSPNQPCGSDSSPGSDCGRAQLSPWPVRVAVWLVLAVLALAAIWLIDRHAMALSEKPSAATTSANQ